MSGVDTGDKHSEELFRESIASLKRNKIGLKGEPATCLSTWTELKSGRYSAYTC